MLCSIALFITLLICYFYRHFLRVIGSAHHVVVEFVAKTNLMKTMSMTMFFSVVTNANIDVSKISVFGASITCMYSCMHGGAHVKLIMVTFLQFNTDHAGCLRKLGHVKLESCPSVTWLCSKECKKVCMTELSLSIFLITLSQHTQPLYNFVFIGLFLYIIPYI